MEDKITTHALIPSDTNPDVTYAVRVVEDEQGCWHLKCECLGYKHKGTCKHTRRVAQEHPFVHCGSPLTFEAKTTRDGWNTLSCNGCESTIYC